MTIPEGGSVLSDLSSQHTANDLQSDVVFDDETETITGTLRYATGVQYAGSDNTYDGYFVAFNVHIPNLPEDASLYVYVCDSTGENGGISPTQENDSNYCFGITRPLSQYTGYICVNAYRLVDGQYEYIVNKIYDTSTLTLEPIPE